MQTKFNKDIILKAVGWFDKPEQKEPVYKPDFDHTLCPVCELPLSDNSKGKVFNHSIIGPTSMYAGTDGEIFHNASVCYLVYKHELCCPKAGAISQEDDNYIDGVILDNPPYNPVLNNG